jgi:hypothetical protein
MNPKKIKQHPKSYSYGTATFKSPLERQLEKEGDPKSNEEYELQEMWKEDGEES